MQDAPHDPKSPPPAPAPTVSPLLSHGVARSLTLPQRIETLIERTVACFVLTPPTQPVYRIVERRRDGILFEAPSRLSAIGGIGRGSISFRKLDGGDTEIMFLLSFHETWEVLVLAGAALAILGTLTVLSAWSTLSWPLLFEFIVIALATMGPWFTYRIIVKRKVGHFEAFFRNLQYIH